MPKKSSKTPEAKNIEFPDKHAELKVQCKTKSGREYFVTHDFRRQEFTLWERVDNEMIKIKSDSSPLDLYERILWDG